MPATKEDDEEADRLLPCFLPHLRLVLEREERHHEGHHVGVPPARKEGRPEEGVDRRPRHPREAVRVRVGSPSISVCRVVSCFGAGGAVIRVMFLFSRGSWHERDVDLCTHTERCCSDSRFLFLSRVGRAPWKGKVIFFGKHQAFPTCGPNWRTHHQSGWDGNRQALFTPMRADHAAFQTKPRARPYTTELRHRGSCSAGRCGNDPRDACSQEMRACTYKRSNFFGENRGKNRRHKVPCCVFLRTQVHPRENEGM